LVPFFCCNSFIIQAGWFSKKKKDEHIISLKINNVNLISLYSHLRRTRHL
jgi:hypothetical protein